MTTYNIGSDSQKHKLMKMIWETPIIIPKSEFDKSSNKEEISDKFQKVIKDYYGIDHIVNFEKITKTIDDEYLKYVFVLNEVDDDSIYSNILNSLESFDELRYTKTEDPLIRPKPYTDLLELYDVYNNQLKEQTEIEDCKIYQLCKKYLKFATKKKIKQLLNLDKDGNFIEVEQIDYKLSLLNKFNKAKYSAISEFLKKNGKTVNNFNTINKQWESDNKEDLKTAPIRWGRMSNELKTDMATSGFNDKLI